MAVADIPVPFAEPVAELLVVGTSAELLVADIVVEPVIEVGMPVAASAEQEPELEVDNLVVLVAEQELAPVADMLVPFAEPVVADMAAACSFEPVAGKSAAVLVVDLLGQIVVPSF